MDKGKDILESAEQGTFSVKSAQTIEENLQWSKYKNNKAGHGFAAEDANALNDKLKGKQVDKVGIKNEKNGADRIVNGKMIQTKYYKNADDSVQSAFDTKTGVYKYKNQKLEVPKDQYEDAVKKMTEKIKEGKVPGVSDPEQAKNIIKKGDVTYQQAKNLAKAGNIDSLLFDMKTQSITATYAFGISFIVQYASCIWSGMDKKDALKLSITSSLKTGGIIFGLGVFTQQFLRTTVGRSFTVFSSNVSKKVIDYLYSSEIGKKSIHKIASAMYGKKLCGKELTGAAAKNAVTKLLRTNLVIAGITTTVMTLPDFYKALVNKKISWKQFSKNLTVNVSSVAGGIGGTWAGTTAGATAGATIGSVIPIIGTTVGAVVGGIIGGGLGGVGVGVGAAVGTKKLLDLITEDDAKEMMQLVQDAVAQLAEDYLITEDEFNNNNVSDKINKVITSKWLESMYQSGKDYADKSKGQISYAYQKFEPLFEEIITKREKIMMPDSKKVKKKLRKTSLLLFFEFIKMKIGQFFGIKSELANS